MVAGQGEGKGSIVLITQQSRLRDTSTTCTCPEVRRERGKSRADFSFQPRRATCHFCPNVISQASHMAIGDFKKGRETQIYHVEQDLVNSPNDSHTFPYNLQEEVGQEKEKKDHKKRRKIKN